MDSVLDNQYLIYVTFYNFSCDDARENEFYDNTIRCDLYNGSYSGAKWIERTLSYLLRLGVNRSQYAQGSIVFLLIYNTINSVIILIIYGLYQLLEHFNYTASLNYLYAAQLMTKEPSVWQTFLVDFLVLNSLMVVFMLFSVAFHRLGKLGGYLIIFGLVAMNILVLSLGMPKPVLDFIRNISGSVVLTIIAVVFILLIMFFEITLKKISIVCAKK